MPLKLNVIEIITADMPAALAFYRRLGLDLPADADGEEHVEIDLGNGVTLSWDTADMIEKINPKYVRPSGGPRIALAFQCDDPAEVDATYADLVAHGARGEMEPFDAEWGPRYAVVLDPDGNGVDLYAARG